MLRTIYGKSLRRTISKSFLISTVTAVVLSTSVLPANAMIVEPELYEFDCSDATMRCEGVNLVNGIKGAVSESMWVPTGATVQYFVKNDANNPFQIGVTVHNTDGVVASVPAHYYGGWNGGTFTSTGSADPSGRYYWISITTGDYTSPYTGKGYATISYAYN